MKIKIYWLVIALGLIAAPISKANEQSELADTVNSYMIESYNYVLNINLLIELCALERYLEVDTNSTSFNQKLHANIKRFAELGKVNDYSANKVAAEVEIKFNAFLQGVRYGGFIADNFVRTQYPKGMCTPEIKKDLDSKIDELIKKDEFKISDIDD